jgi:hypothetical protein
MSVWVRYPDLNGHAADIGRSPFVTHSGLRRPDFAVMHNTVIKWGLTVKSSCPRVGDPLIIDFTSR